MLNHIHYELSLFERGSDRDEEETNLGWALEFLTQCDQAYLARHPECPRLYKSGVVYERPKQMLGDCEELAVIRWALEGSKRANHPRVREVLRRVQEVFGGEHFCDVGVIRKRGRIDCDGLACWRSAELRQRGIPASPYITSRDRPDGGTTYHVIVRWPDGTSEDPSLLLGMGGAERAADRAEEIRKNQERCDNMRAERVAERAAGRVAKVERGWTPRVVRASAPTVVDFGLGDADVAAALRALGRRAA